MRFILTFLAAVSLVVTGCDTFSGSDAQTAQVSVQFKVIAPPANAAKGSFSSALDDGLIIEGTNGTLSITDIRLIVAEFELERDEECGDDDHGDECEEFSAPPFFADLPLESGVVTVATGDLPPGRYTELEFEVEDLELDEGDDDDEQQQRNLLRSIRSTFPDWPSEASVMLVGSFTPLGGSPRPFRAFAEAEIEVELALTPALVITAEDDDQFLTVQVNPVVWFKAGDGSVLDLSAYDFETTGRLLEFELEIEDGFTGLETEIEIDDENDDDDDD